MSERDGSYLGYPDFAPLVTWERPAAVTLESPYLFSGRALRYKITTIVNAWGTVLRLGYRGSFPGRCSLYLDILASGHTPARPADVMFMRLPADFFLCGDPIGQDFAGPVGDATIRVERKGEVVWFECDSRGDEPIVYGFRMTEEVYRALIAAGRAAVAEMSDHEVDPS